MELSKKNFVEEVNLFRINFDSGKYSYVDNFVSSFISKSIPPDPYLWIPLRN